MQFIGTILLAALLVLFGLLTLGMGVCATAYTADTTGLSLLFGIPVTGVLGFIVYLLWRALGETKSPAANEAEDDVSP